MACIRHSNWACLHAQLLVKLQRVKIVKWAVLHVASNIPVIAASAPVLQSSMGSSHLIALTFAASMEPLIPAACIYSVDLSSKGISLASQESSWSMWAHVDHTSPVHSISLFPPLSSKLSRLKWPRSFVNNQYA